MPSANTNLVLLAVATGEAGAEEGEEGADGSYVEEDDSDGAACAVATSRAATVGRNIDLFREASLGCVSSDGLEKI